MKGRESSNGGYQMAADFITNFFDENGIELFIPGTKIPYKPKRSGVIT
jgi:hypothetical protein